MNENRNKLEHKDSHKPQSGFLPGNTDAQKQLDDWFDSLHTNDSQTPFGGNEDKDAIKQRIFNNVLERIEESEKDTKPVRTIRLGWLKVAASVLLISAISLISYQYWYGKKEVIEYVTVTASNGRVMQVTLSDSTNVWLQAGSTLKYPKSFSDTSREVYLDEGLAFFKVTHNKKKPFIVHTQDINTRVLGTSFVIKSYNQLEDVQVDLLTGKVRVSHNSEIIGELTPNKRLIYHKASAKAEIEELNTEASANFVRGDVVLQRAGFDELFTTLHNIYGYDFKYDAIVVKNCKFNIRFNTRLKLEEVLEIINGIHPLKYEIKNKEVMIKMKGCNNNN
ncbi:FecR family protein [Solitalea koreensis]|uniref:FecR family protein n=1 Tax=Solitalea koreensis TaxID=543615 RepID=A0A521CAH9_9SPHI|nr:FecR family protein [Solitalea koreensis]SMO56406.1 FecR family protein [Solitalea koreensis]